MKLLFNTLLASLMFLAGASMLMAQSDPSKPTKNAHDCKCHHKKDNQHNHANPAKKHDKDCKKCNKSKSTDGKPKHCKECCNDKAQKCSKCKGENHAPHACNPHADKPHPRPALPNVRQTTQSNPTSPTSVEGNSSSNSNQDKEDYQSVVPMSNKDIEGYHSHEHGEASHTH